MNNVLSRGGFALVAVCGAALAFGGMGLQKSASASQPARPAEPGGAPEEPPGLDQMGQQLVAGLRSVEGCLGVDTGNFQSGKNTIVAWFENKAAVERWYNHPTHVRMIGAVGSRPEDRTPLEHVDDPDIPGESDPVQPDLDRVVRAAAGWRIDQRAAGSGGVRGGAPPGPGGRRLTACVVNASGARL